MAASAAKAEAGVRKFNHSTGATSDIHYGQERVGDEPGFVPPENSASEDEGYLTTYDCGTNQAAAHSRRHPRPTPIRLDSH